MTTTHTYVVRLVDTTDESDTMFIGPFPTMREARAFAKRRETSTVEAYVESVMSPHPWERNVTPAELRAFNRGFNEALKDPAASFAADFPELVAKPDTD
jgi:hypothetical protein